MLHHSTKVIKMTILRHSSVMLICHLCFCFIYSACSMPSKLNDVNNERLPRAKLINKHPLKLPLNKVRRLLVNRYRKLLKKVTEREDEKQLNRIMRKVLEYMVGKEGKEQDPYHRGKQDKLITFIKERRNYRASDKIRKRIARFYKEFHNNGFLDRGDNLLHIFLQLCPRVNFQKEQSFLRELIKKSIEYHPYLLDGKNSVNKTPLETLFEQGNSHFEQLIGGELYDLPNEYRERVIDLALENKKLTILRGMLSMALEKEDKATSDRLTQLLKDDAIKPKRLKKLVEELRKAIQADNLEEVKNIIKNTPRSVLVNEPDKDNKLPLQVAIEAFALETFTFLLSLPETKIYMNERGSRDHPTFLLCALKMCQDVLPKNEHEKQVAMLRMLGRLQHKYKTFLKEHPNKIRKEKFQDARPQILLALPDTDFVCKLVAKHPEEFRRIIQYYSKPISDSSIRNKIQKIIEYFINNQKEFFSETGNIEDTISRLLPPIYEAYRNPNSNIDEVEKGQFCLKMSNTINEKYKKPIQDAKEPRASAAAG